MSARPNCTASPGSTPAGLLRTPGGSLDWLPIKQETPSTASPCNERLCLSDDTASQSCSQNVGIAKVTVTVKGGFNLPGRPALGDTVYPNEETWQSEPVVRLHADEHLDISSRFGAVETRSLGAILGAMNAHQSGTTFATIVRGRYGCHGWCDVRFEFSVDESSVDPNTDPVLLALRNIVGGDYVWLRSRRAMKATFKSNDNGIQAYWRGCVDDGNLSGGCLEVDGYLLHQIEFPPTKFEGSIKRFMFDVDEDNEKVKVASYGFCSQKHAHRYQGSLIQDMAQLLLEDLHYNGAKVDEMKRLNVGYPSMEYVQNERLRSQRESNLAFKTAIGKAKKNVNNFFDGLKGGHHMVLVGQGYGFSFVLDDGVVLERT